MIDFIHDLHCIEADHPRALLKHPCRCYRKRLTICLNGSVYYLTACRNWIKYMKEKDLTLNDLFYKNYSYEFKSIPEEVFSLLILDNNIASAQEFCLESNPHRLSPYCKSYFHFLLRKYPYCDSELIKSRSAIINRISKNPYVLEAVYQGRDTNIFNYIHICDYIQKITNPNYTVQLNKDIPMSKYNYGTYEIMQKLINNNKKFTTSPNRYIKKANLPNTIRFISNILIKNYQTILQ